MMKSNFVVISIWLHQSTGQSQAIIQWNTIPQSINAIAQLSHFLNTILRLILDLIIDLNNNK